MKDSSSMLKRALEPSAADIANRPHKRQKTDEDAAETASASPAKVERVKGLWPVDQLKFKAWTDFARTEILRNVFLERGWKLDLNKDGHLCDPDNLDTLLTEARKTDYCLWWVDEHEAEIIHRVRGNHRINSILGVNSACNKTTMSNLRGIRDAPWYPKTYVLPRDAELAIAAASADELTHWISKPTVGHAGHGMTVYRSDQPEFKTFVEAHARKRCVIQEYITNPMLIDGLKFHLRVYCVIERMNPVQIYLHKSAFHVWFASQPYTNDASTLGDNFKPLIHLTNRGVNIEKSTAEESEFISKDKPTLGKSIEMTADHFIRYCEEHHGKGEEHIIDQLTTILGPTMHGVATHAPIRAKNAHLKGKLADRAFELFGVDILVDDACNLLLCEVNRSPGISYPPKYFNNGEPNPHFEPASIMQETMVHDLMALLRMDSCPKGDAKAWVPLDAPKKLAHVG